MFSRYFGDFAEDGTALSAFHSFVAKVSEGRVVLDASFDSTKVEARVPVIDGNRRRGGDAAKLSATEAERRVRIVPADKARYRARSGVERVNGHLHAARNKSLRRGAVYLGVHEHAGGAKPSASGKAVVMSRVSK